MRNDPKGSKLSLEEFLDLLDNVQPSGDGWKAKCPLHESSSGLNLNISAGRNGTPLVHCHARGCDYGDIVHALQSKRYTKKQVYKGRLFEYHDLSGELIAVHKHKGPWYQPMPDGTFLGNEPEDRPLFNLSGVIDAIRNGETVYVTEGEKDAETMIELGYTATTSGGATSWRDRYSGWLAGARVVILPDNDEEGESYLGTVATSLRGIARSVGVVRLPDLPPKGDVTDWMQSHTAEDLIRFLVPTEFTYSPPRELKMSVRGFTAAELFDMTPEKPDWLLPHLLVKGGVTDLFGEAKTSGKTTFVVHALAAMLSGTWFLGHELKPVRALVLSEMSYQDEKDYLEGAGVQPSDALRVLFRHDLLGLSWWETMGLAREILETEERDLLVIDTFAAFAGLSGAEENDAGHITDRLMVCREIAGALHTAVWNIRHSNKEGKARGSTAFEATVDIMAAYKRPHGDEDTNVRVLDVIGRPTGSTYRTHVELTRHGFTDQGSRSDMQFNKTLAHLRARVDGTPRTREELLEGLSGVSESTVKKVFVWWQESGEVSRTGKGIKGYPYRYVTPKPIRFTGPEPKPIEQVHQEGGSEEKNEDENRIDTPETDETLHSIDPMPTYSVHEGGSSVEDLNQIGGVLVTDDASAARAAEALDTPGTVGIDIETTALDPREGRPRLVQLATADAAVIVDVDRYDPTELIRRVSDRGLVAHNATFERSWIRHHFGIDIGTIDDTMVMSHVLYGGTPKDKDPKFSHGLEAVVGRQLGREFDKTEQTSDWSAEELTADQLEYALRDAQILLELTNNLMPQLEEHGLMDVYALELRASHAVDQMERTGIAVNLERIDDFIEENTEKANRIKAELAEAWGINPGSPDQLADHFNLAERSGWPKTPKGAPSTNQDAMASLAGEEPLIEKWLEWKAVEKLRSTYGASLVRHVADDGRLRARFNPFGTASGRFSSSKPNMQNIPRDATIRAFFYSGHDDRVLITADYASIEIWIAAIRWHDEHMMSVLAEGTSIHKATAAALFNKPVDEVTDDEKAVGKTANFALLYGAGEDRLRAQFEQAKVPMNKQETQKMFKTFFKTYTGFAQRRYAARNDWKAGEYTEARTPIGRRRTYGDWYGPLMNHEIQGTGADGIKYALARLYEQGDLFPTAKVVLTVHDEIVVEADKEQKNEVEAWVEEQMVAGMLDAMRGYEGRIPIDPKVETKVAREWTK